MSGRYGTLAAVSDVDPSRGTPTDASPALSVDDLVRETGGRLLARSERPVRGAAVDSRLVAKDNLFVALPGERTDGHFHLKDFTDAFGSLYLGEDGERHPIVMGSYGIGLGRNVACIVEAHHDEKGIAWPAEVAPYAAHLVEIGAAREPRVSEVAERLHAIAAEAGPAREILWDDRDESPGVKFTDAELLGMPWILTVSPRSLAAGGVEVTERASGSRSTQSLEAVEAFLRGEAASPVRDEVPA